MAEICFLSFFLCVDRSCLSVPIHHFIRHMVARSVHQCKVRFNLLLELVYLSCEDMCMFMAIFPSPVTHLFSDLLKTEYFPTCN